jgi:4-carboxymuconolactone decarboxylase
MRSPELMDRLQRVGEYLRFQSTVPTKLNELAMCITARHTTNHFEWAVHYPLARESGVAPAALDAIGEGRHPHGLDAAEEQVHDFVTELLAHHGVCETTYERATAALGEQGVIELVALVGYFITVCLVMNVAHTPPPASAAPPLGPRPG